MDLAVLTAALLCFLCSTTLQNRISPNQPEEIKVSGEAGICGQHHSGVWNTENEELHVRNVSLLQGQESEVNHDSVHTWKQKREKQLPSSAAREATLRGWLWGGWEGEKAAHPQAKEVTEAAEGDQQIGGLFRCCSPIRHCLCGGGGGDNQSCSASSLGVGIIKYEYESAN